MTTPGSKSDKPMFNWKVDTMCSNCPFMEEGDGRVLRDSLGKGRWDGILFGLLHGGHFNCHKTTNETGNGTELYCAGALAFQVEHEIDTPYMRICRSFEGTRETKKEMFRRLRGSVKKRGT